MGELGRQSYRIRDAACSALAGADYELATAARMLKDSGDADLSAEAESVFRAALNVRHKLEIRLGRRDG